jgi:hypothetical protein
MLAELLTWLSSQNADLCFRDFNVYVYGRGNLFQSVSNYYGKSRTAAITEAILNFKEQVENVNIPAGNAP